MRTICKKSNYGSDYLIPKNEWVDPNEIQGDEMKTLKHPLIEKAFQKILSDFQPQHKVCLMSLCTTSRPYITSQKWKKFDEMYSRDCDLIVCSNGGIIPQKYWNCYPYLTYDAHGNSKYDEEYIAICYRRITEFFNKFHYDKIVFNFRPTLRNRVAAEHFKQDCIDNNIPVEIEILPTEETYYQCKSEGFPHGKVMPDLDPRVLKELSNAIGVQERIIEETNLFEVLE